MTSGKDLIDIPERDLVDLYLEIGGVFGTDGQAVIALLVSCVDE